jgi:hypothetical protein
MPHNSYMIYDTDAAMRQLRTHDDVLWIGSWLPEYKVRRTQALETPMRC